MNETNDIVLHQEIIKDHVICIDLRKDMIGVYKIMNGMNQNAPSHHK